MKKQNKSQARKIKKVPAAQNSSADKQNNSKSKVCFVGIGASAGGLEALRSLFGALQPTKRLSFLVVQHLAPLHRSRMVELVGHATTLRVQEVRNGIEPKPGVVYITPPNADLLCKNGKLVLRKPKQEAGPKPSIDLFFRSLAEDQGEESVGIILSGTGSDGSLGVRAIKAAGGLTIAQRMETAKYDGMPKSAKHTGAVDLELSPEEIARELARIDKLDRPVHSALVESKIEGEPYARILDFVQRQGGANFSDYKQSTVRRRIERRIVATRCESVEEYAKYLTTHNDEAKNLFQDILISVTSFFRDPTAFRSLRHPLTERFSKKKPNDSFRCWIVGCATGEEAYSFAILLNEIAEKVQTNTPIQIFATDLDEHALSYARKAIYPKACFDDLPPGLVEKYFNPVEDRLQVKSFLRDRVIFAKHNVGEDPPFLNLDLVSCRNVLIYFNNKLQDKVFYTLHYSLDSGGILFLGKSEAVPASNPLFELVDKNAKIYYRLDKKGEIPRPLPRQEMNREAALISKERGSELQGELFHAMVAGTAPDSVLVDEQFQVSHVFGDAGTFLVHPPGEATQKISRLVPEKLSTELSNMLSKAQKTNTTQIGRKHELGNRSNTYLLEQRVIPLNASGRRQFLVSFHRTRPEIQEVDKAATRKGTSEDYVLQLQYDLSAVREHLQTVLEEQETSNEELQALNEELQSANEELQSSNEELETTNEELQSTNEELTTLNQELNVKTGELQALNQRLQAIQTAIVYPLVIVDRNKHLVNFNPAARYLLRINEGDIGSHISNIPSYLDLQDVIKSVDEALRKETDRSIQFRTKDRSFEIQIQIIRNNRNDSEGAVVSFVENTEIVNALEESRMNRLKFSNILENTPAMVTMKDFGGVYIYANRQFCSNTGLEKEDLLGKTDEEVFGSELGQDLREKDFEVVRKKKSIESEDVFFIQKQKRHWISSRFPLLDNKKRVQSVCTVSLDITDRVQHEQRLELFQAAITASNVCFILFRKDPKAHTAVYVSAYVKELFASAKSSFNVGKTLDEFLNLPAFKWKSDDLEKVRSEILRSQTSSHVVHFSSKSARGESFLEFRSSIVHPKSSEDEFLVLSILDVTDRVVDHRTIAAQQEELTTFGRFSALGEISAGIAHEINTPLNVITTKTDLLRKFAEKNKMDPGMTHRAATDIDRMVKSVSSIVEGLRSIAGLDPEKFETADLRVLIRDTLKICEFRLQRYGVELQTELPNTPTPIECFPVQIIQILINLINNSIEAISELHARWIKIELTEVKGIYHLRVTDSGKGIPANIAEKIMTPFFSTKKEKKGTGIGLSLSRTIARRHNGDLQLDFNALNTSFILTLPREQKSS